MLERETLVLCIYRWDSELKGFIIIQKSCVLVRLQCVLVCLHCTMFVLLAFSTLMMRYDHERNCDIREL